MVHQLIAVALGDGSADVVVLLVQSEAEEAEVMVDVGATVH
jgi:hypothetical protein